jgi:hypothetical protein
MNKQVSGQSLFSRLRFVLVNTSSPGNIGSAARAIKTMGFSELVLVNPRFPDAVKEDEAIAFASGAWMCCKMHASSAAWKKRCKDATLPPPSAPVCANFRRRWSRRANWRPAVTRYRAQCRAAVRQ